MYFYLCSWRKKEEKKETLEEKEGIFGVVIALYKKTIKFALKHRLLVISSFSVFFFLMIFLAGRFLPFIMFPPGSEEEIEIKTWMPIGSTLQKNLETIEKLEPALNNSWW